MFVRVSFRQSLCYISFSLSHTCHPRKKINKVTSLIFLALDGMYVWTTKRDYSRTTFLSHSTDWRRVDLPSPSPSHLRVLLGVSVMFSKDEIVLIHIVMRWKKSPVTRRTKRNVLEMKLLIINVFHIQISLHYFITRSLNIIHQLTSPTLSGSFFPITK